jgi:DNA modification methylase
MSKKLPKKRSDTRKPSGKSFKKALAIARRADRKSANGSLAIHPFAELLPMMNEAEFAALESDIVANGVRDDIDLYEGKILDGRNRHAIAIKHKLPFKTRVFKGTPEEALNHVYSRANRRNLSDSQKACAAVHFDAKFSEQAKARALANLKQNADSKEPWPLGAELKVPNHTSATKYDHVAVVEYKDDLITLVALSGPREGDKVTVPVDNLKEMKPELQTVRSRDRAAALFGVSGRYVQQAKLLLAHDKKLFDQVFNGQMALTKATRSIHREKKKKAIAAITPPDVNLDNCTVEVADNLDFLPDMPRRFARLIVADPQYNIGYDYGKGAKGDQLSDKEYLKRAAEWLGQCAEILTPDGSIWVVINHEYAAHYEIIMRDLGLRPRAWVTWYETFGNNCQENFNRTSRRLLYFTKQEKNFVFNREPFTRKSARQIIYGDKRADHDGKLQDDVWIIPRLVDNAKERIPEIPTQLPRALVQPIVEGCSDPGDVVVDPFNGSGTTGECCLLTGRIFRGVEISKDFAALARARWARCAAELQKKQGVA